MTKINNFEDLIVWQEAQRFAATVYRETSSFPKSEIFGLTSQIRRSAVSVSVNTAEGFGRKTNQDKLHFYTMAYGSLLETKNFIYLAERLQYIEKESKESLVN